MAPQFPLPAGALSPQATGLLSPATATTSAPFVITSAAMNMMPSMAAGQASAAIPLGAIPMDLTKINPYIYTPSFSIAILGSMAFLISAAIHITQLINTRAWYFFIIAQAPLVAAASLIARTQSVLTLSVTGATGPFIAFTTLDMAVGSITSIGIIFTYTRVMFWVTPEDKRNFATLWSPPMFTSFMWGFLLFIGDGIKIGIQIGLDRKSRLSMTLQLIAQVYQFFVLGGFAFTTYRFMMISRRWLIHGECEEKNWRALGWTIVINASIMTLRHIFTIIQLDSRTDPLSFFSLHEWVFWLTLELPIFLVLTLFNLNYPGFFLPRIYTGFVLNLKKIAAMKKDAQWPLSISAPFPMRGPDMLEGGRERDERTLVEVISVGKAA